MTGSLFKKLHSTPEMDAAWLRRYLEEPISVWLESRNSLPKVPKPRKWLPYLWPEFSRRERNGLGGDLCATAVWCLASIFPGRRRPRPSCRRTRPSASRRAARPASTPWSRSRSQPRRRDRTTSRRCTRNLHKFNNRRQKLTPPFKMTILVVHKQRSRYLLGQSLLQTEPGWIFSTFWSNLLPNKCEACRRPCSSAHPVQGGHWSLVMVSQVKLAGFSCLGLHSIGRALSSLEVVLFKCPHSLSPTRNVSFRRVRSVPSVWSFPPPASP